MADGTSGNGAVSEAGTTTTTTTTTTTSSSGGGGSSWWGGWVKSAMETSTSALEFIKRDLVEFTSTMERDTTRAAEVTKSVLQESLKKENSLATRDKVKQGMNKVFDGLSKVLTTSAPEKPAQKASSSSGSVFDRKLARLHAVQVDTGTYLNEPSGDPEEFRAWQAGFNLEEKKGEISELLVSKVEVRALYTRLVPSEVSHGDFWQRYFYKLHQLKQDELRKQALMKRAEKQPSDEDSLDWEDDWSGDEEESTLCEDPRLTAPAAEPNSSTSPAGESSPSTSPRTRADPSTPASASSDVQAPAPNLPVIDATPSSPASSPLLDADKGNRPAATTPPPSDQRENEHGVETVEDCSLGEGKESGSVEVGTPAAGCGKSQGPAPSSVSAPSLPEPRLESSPSPQEAEAGSADHSGDEPKTKTAKEAETASVLSPVAAEENRDQLQVPVSAAGEGAGKAAEGLGELSVAVPGEAAAAATAAAQGGAGDLKTRVKGDMVLVGSERESPTSDSSECREASLEEDWEQDFDVELTEEDLKAAEELAKHIGSDVDLEDDWESWD